MVKSSSKDKSLVVYDVVGGGLVLAIALFGLWSTFVHLPDSNKRLEVAQKEMGDLKRSLRAVEVNLSSSNVELANVEAEVSERGALPKSAPVNANLQAITRLIRSNKIDLITVDPGEQKQYPGLTQLNYRVECRSGFGAILAFLEDFESEPFWADLTKLRILGAPASFESKDATHRAEFVVSLFAAHSSTEAGDKP